MTSATQLVRLPRITTGMIVEIVVVLLLMAAIVPAMALGLLPGGVIGMVLVAVLAGLFLGLRTVRAARRRSCTGCARVYRLGSDQTFHCDDCDLTHVIGPAPASSAGGLKRSWSRLAFLGLAGAAVFCGWRLQVAIATGCAVGRRGRRYLFASDPSGFLFEISSDVLVVAVLLLVLAIHAWAWYRLRQMRRLLAEVSAPTQPTHGQPADDQPAPTDPSAPRDAPAPDDRH